MLRILVILAIATLAGWAEPKIDEMPAPAQVDALAWIEAELGRPAASNAEADRKKPDGCCKVCSKGKPCGDTCIAKDKQCHVGPGCAC